GCSDFSKVARTIAAKPQKSREAVARRDFWSLAGFRAFGECENAASSQAGAAPPSLRRFTPGERIPKPSPRLLRLHPLEFRQLMPKPGELPFGVVAGIGAADRRRLLKRDLSLKMPEQRRHAMGLHRRQQRIEMPCRQRRDFLQRARCKHRVEARIDPRIKLIAIGREKQRAEFSWRQ